MNKVPLSYIAGIIDGEGCINLNRKRRKTQDAYIIRILICNTNLELLNICRNTLESGEIHKQKMYNKNAKEAYVLSIHGSKAIKLLKKIAKYLLVKKKQAELIIELTRVNEISWKKNGKRIVPEALNKERERIYLEMKRLNRRGV